MRTTCKESRRAIRNLAERRQIVTYADDKNHDNPVVHLEMRPTRRSAVDAEERVRLVPCGWGDRATLRRKRQAERDLELDTPIYHGTTITQLTRLLNQGKLRAAS